MALMGIILSKPYLGFNHFQDLAFTRRPLLRHEVVHILVYTGEFKFIGAMYLICADA